MASTRGSIRERTPEGTSAHRLRHLLASAADVRSEERLALERAVNWARWGAAAVLFSVGPAYPNIGLAYVLSLGVFLVAYGTIVRALQRRLTGRAADVLPLATYALDILVTVAAMVIFAPDWQWNTFVYGALIVIIGAFRFGRIGAYGGAIALSVAYTVIALYREPVFGHVFELSRTTTNVAFLMLTAMLMTVILRELHALRARQRDFYEPLLRAQSDLGEAIVVVDGQTPLYWNEALGQLVARDRAQLAALRSIYDLIAPEERARVMARVGPGLEDGRGATFETRLVRPDGSEVSVEVALEPFRRRARDWVVVVVRDITERREAQLALQHQALHDPLTGLANRSLLADRLELAIAAARRASGTLALLLMDLDDFKVVNDSLGHHAGDALLVELGARLRDLGRATDTLARLGGDEFAVVLPGADAAGAFQVARELLNAVEMPFVVDGHRLNITASVGVSLFPELASNADVLLRQADMAMYAAKRQRATFALYDPSAQPGHEHGLEELLAPYAARSVLTI